MVLPPASAAVEIAEAMRIVEEYGALCEAMYLVMVADRKVVNLERDVLRGALRVLSNDVVRTKHMESMIDHAARKLVEDGYEARLKHVIEVLKADPQKADLTYILAAAVAAADHKVTDEEEQLLSALAEGLGIDEARANELLADFEKDP